MIKHINDNLSKDEEIAYGVQVQEGLIAKERIDNNDYENDKELKSLYDKVLTMEDAVEVLSRNYINLARKIAHNYHKTTGTRYPIDDLIQDAISALIESIYRYNPKANCTLGTYAYSRIAKKVSSEINRQRIVRLPENRMGEYIEINKAKVAYSYIDKPEMTEYDFIIQETGYDPIMVDIIMNNMKPTVSLNVTVKDGDNELGDVLDINPDNNDGILISYEDLDVSLAEIVKKLDQKERDLVAFEFGAFMPSVGFEEFMVKYDMDEDTVNRETRRVVRKMKRMAERVDR